MIDTHTHLNLEPLHNDVDRYLSQAVRAGVHKMLVIGTDVVTSQTAVTLASQYKEIYASVGIHPEEAGAYIANSRQLSASLEKLLDSKIVKAIGECGLDYSGEVDHLAQQGLFMMQVEMAIKHDLPLIIHCRNTRSPDQQVKGSAYEDLLEVLENLPSSPRFVLHCVSGPLDYIRRALNLGAMISFAGNVTYPSAHAIREITRITPRDRILVETDAPFLAPQSRRGQTNEPAFVTETGRYLADLLDLSFEELDQLTTENAIAFFRF